MNNLHHLHTPDPDERRRDPMDRDEWFCLMHEHARLTASTGASYEQVARYVGGTVSILLCFWLLLGSPGIPAASGLFTDSVFPYLDAHEVQAWLIGFAAVALFVIGETQYRLPRALRAVLKSPITFSIRVVHNAVLLLGVATVGLCVGVPTVTAAHLLGVA